MTDTDRSLMTERQMEGVAPLAQAKRAISHALNAIAEDERKWELLGFGTQSFALLTEAAATLFDRRLDDVREHFCEKRSTSPRPSPQSGEGERNPKKAA